VPSAGKAPPRPGPGPFASLSVLNPHKFSSTEKSLRCGPSSGRTGPPRSWTIPRRSLATPSSRASPSAWSPSGEQPELQSSRPFAQSSFKPGDLPLAPPVAAFPDQGSRLIQVFAQCAAVTRVVRSGRAGVNGVEEAASIAESCAD